MSNRKNKKTKKNKTDSYSNNSKSRSKAELQAHEKEHKSYLAGRIISAILVAAAICGLLFWCVKSDPEHFDKIYIAICGLIALLGALLCLLKKPVPKGFAIPVIILIPAGAFFLLESMTHDITTLLPGAIILNLIFFWILYLFLWFVIGRVSVAYIIATILVTFAGVINYYILQFRGQPVLPWDVTSIGTALSVSDNYIFAGSRALFIAVSGMIILGVLSWKCALRIPPRGRVIGIFAGLLVGFAFIGYLRTDNCFNTFDLYDIPFTQWMNYRKDGFAVGFTMASKYISVEVPDGYSPEAAAALIEEYAEAYDAEHPNPAALPMRDTNTGVPETTPGSEPANVNGPNIPANTTDQSSNSEDETVTAETSANAQPGTNTEASSETAESGADTIDSADETAAPGSWSGSSIVANNRPRSTETPNVIVIVNEAFSDLRVLGDLDTSENVMPCYDSLVGSDNTITGSMYVSILGGNTANTELEFLTGASMAFLPTGSVPYQQLISDDVPSMAWTLQQEGYNTYGMHPYPAEGWNRVNVYPRLGFAYPIFREDYTQFRAIRTYCSDASNYDMIKNVVTDSTDPAFVFNVTMQNHGSYFRTYANFTPDVTIGNYPLGTFPKAETYLSLIKISDTALYNLLHYYATSDEDTVIVFFGDHQPTLLEHEFFTHLAGTDMDTWTNEQTADRYQVPFLIWANFDIDEQTDVVTSANFLSSLVCDAAGMTRTPLQSFLAAIAEKYPVVTANFYYDADGNYHEITRQSELPEELRDYAIVQYGVLFDGVGAEAVAAE